MSSREIDGQDDKFYTSAVADIREIAIAHASSDVSVNQLFLNRLSIFLRKEARLLDIGTGNGYLLDQIFDEFSCCQLELTGIDISRDMLAKTRARANIAYACANNYDMPFADSAFDVVTAKNVTAFSATEVCRVLKNGGIFLMREYAEGKGLVELANMFKSRLIRSRSISFYSDRLEDAGFEILETTPLTVKRKFSDAAALLNTIKSYHFMENISANDEKIIAERFTGTFEITSDPFIITARKQRCTKNEENRFSI